MVHTHQEIYKIINEDGNILLNQYTNARAKLEVKCQCGETFNITYARYREAKYKMCNKCRRKITKNRLNIEDIRETISEGNCILLSIEYKNNRTKLEIQCHCNGIFYKTLDEFRISHECPSCARHSQVEYAKFDYNYVYDYFKKYDCLLLSKEYINNRELLDYKCSCGNISKISFDGFSCGERCRKCGDIKNGLAKLGKERLDMRGEHNNRWNPNLTDEDRINRRDISWRNLIYYRDQYTCQICGDKIGHNLNAHHLNGYNWCIEERTDIDNGITLCDKCHSLDNNSFHKIHGFGNNTKEQFIEWANIRLHSIIPSISNYKYSTINH